MAQLDDLAGGLFTETRRSWSRLNMPDPVLERAIERGRRLRLAGVKETKGISPDRQEPTRANAPQSKPKPRGETYLTPETETHYLPQQRQSPLEPSSAFYH